MCLLACASGTDHAPPAPPTQLRRAALTTPSRTRTRAHTHAHTSLTFVVKRSSSPPCRRAAHLQCAVCGGLRGQAPQAGQTLLPRRNRGVIFPAEASELPETRLCLFFFSHPGCVCLRGCGGEHDSVTMVQSCLTAGRRFVLLPFFLFYLLLKNNPGRFLDNSPFWI